MGVGPSESGRTMAGNEIAAKDRKECKRKSKKAWIRSPLRTLAKGTFSLFFAFFALFRGYFILPAR